MLCAGRDQTDRNAVDLGSRISARAPQSDIEAVHPPHSLILPIQSNARMPWRIAEAYADMVDRDVETRTTPAGVPRGGELSRRDLSTREREGDCEGAKLQCVS